MGNVRNITRNFIEANMFGKTKRFRLNNQAIMYLVEKYGTESDARKALSTETGQVSKSLVDAIEEWLYACSLHDGKTKREEFADIVDTGNVTVLLSIIYDLLTGSYPDSDDTKKKEQTE